MSAPEFDNLEPAAAPRKSNAARNWLIGCGGCAVLALLAFIGIIVVVKGPIERWAKQGSDPEKAWPIVQQSLPFEQRPAQAEVKFAGSIGFVGMTMAKLTDKRNGAKVDLLALPRSQTSSFDQLFDAAESGQSDLANLSPLFAPVEGELEVQGRNVRTLFGRAMSKQDGEANAVKREVSKLRIDLSGASGDHLCLQYELPTGDAHALEAAAIEFLSEFQLWKSL